MNRTGSIKKLERFIGETEYSKFEVGKDISEIINMTNESEQGQIYHSYHIHYRNGVVLELLGGIFTITRNATK